MKVKVLLLTHYCRNKQNSNFPETCTDRPDHDGHKPGGLWVGDEESGQGWKDFALKRREDDPANWRDHPKYGDIKNDLMFRYVFRIRPSRHSDILVIRDLADLAQFTESYGEANPRPCADEWKSSSGFGVHINWQEVKKDFRGILVSPFHPKVKEQEKYHWYTFDCASGCFWNTSCLELVGWEETIWKEGRHSDPAFPT